MTVFVFLIMCHLVSYTQIVGGFTIGNDGHIYFQAGNNTYYTYQVTIVAVSSDRRNSEQRVIVPGNGFYLGPTTPWRWYWKQDDKISVVYANGQTQTWTCPQSDKIYNENISFKGKHCSGTEGCGCSGFPLKRVEMYGKKLIARNVDIIRNTISDVAVFVE